MRRIFQIDVLACACGGRLRFIATIEDPPVVQRILRHLGFPTDTPVQSDQSYCDLPTGQCVSDTTCPAFLTGADGTQNKCTFLQGVDPTTGVCLYYPKLCAPRGCVPPSSGYPLVFHDCQQLECHYGVVP